MACLGVEPVKSNHMYMIDFLKKKKKKGGREEHISSTRRHQLSTKLWRVLEKSHCQLIRLSQASWSTECEWLEKEKKMNEKGDKGELTDWLDNTGSLSHCL